MSSRDLTRQAILTIVKEDYSKFLEAIVLKYGDKATKKISVEILKEQFPISDIRTLQDYRKKEFNYRP